MWTHIEVCVRENKIPIFLFCIAYPGGKILAKY